MEGAIHIVSACFAGKKPGQCLSTCKPGYSCPTIPLRQTAILVSSPSARSWLWVGEQPDHTGVQSARTTVPNMSSNTPGQQYHLPSCTHSSVHFKCVTVSQTFWWSQWRDKDGHCLGGFSKWQICGVMAGWSANLFPSLPGT